MILRDSTAITAYRRLVAIFYIMNHAGRISRRGAYEADLLSADSGSYAARKRRIGILYAVHHNL